MIEDLKNTDLINKMGGRFRFTALVQKRWRELLFGARPLIEPGDMTQLEIAIREIAEGKIVPKEETASDKAD